MEPGDRDDKIHQASSGDQDGSPTPELVDAQRAVAELEKENQELRQALEAQFKAWEQDKRDSWIKTHELQEQLAKTEFDYGLQIIQLYEQIGSLKEAWDEDRATSLEIINDLRARLQNAEEAESSTSSGEDVASGSSPTSEDGSRTSKLGGAQWVAELKKKVQELRAKLASTRKVSEEDRSTSSERIKDLQERWQNAEALVGEYVSKMRAMEEALSSLSEAREKDRSTSSQSISDLQWELQEAKYQVVLQRMLSTLLQLAPLSVSDSHGRQEAIGRKTASPWRLVCLLQTPLAMCYQRPSKHPKPPSKQKQPCFPASNPSKRIQSGHIKPSRVAKF